MSLAGEDKCVLKTDKNHCGLGQRQISGSETSEMRGPL